MTSKCVNIRRTGPFSADEVASAALELRQATGGTAQFALAFVTPGYFPHIEEFSEIVRVDGHVIELVGSTGLGLTSGAVETEEEEGFSLLSFTSSKASFRVASFAQHTVEESRSAAAWHKDGGDDPEAWIVLANPFVFDAETWLGEWNGAYPGISSVGGLASGTNDGSNVGVFHNGRVVDALAVAVNGLKVMPVVSQGCRPIGEPLTVTRAESNVVYSLGSHPAYEALESAFEGLSEGEKATAKGNLFAGLAGTEYVEDFKPGDFLIRDILGADPNSGAVQIGGIPRIGQTLQYQLRNKTSADAEWRTVLRAAASEIKQPPVASLLFACSGRGSRLFESQSHDAGLLEEIIGTHPSAGFFCNGEIAPLGGRSYIHSYTACCALFFDDESSS